MKATIVYQKNMESKTRITVNEGGTRSSKTYSLAQLMLMYLLSENNILITVCRKTLPALKSTAMKDFFDVLKSMNLYHEDWFNKSDLIYKIGGNEIEFISVDQPQKIRGRKRQILWMNEANEFSYDDFMQLNLRTTDKVFMDYNPSDMYSWIYDHVFTRDDVTIIKSTYRDNSFLGRETIKEIERLKNTDENYWRIYGLGERGISGTKIYTHWKYCDDVPEDAEKIFGLDFGFNHPSALTEIRIKDNSIYVKEHIYKSGLTDDLLIMELDKLTEQGVLTKNDYIYGDTEDAKAITNIRNAGYNIKPANKGPGSVLSGIKLIKSKQFFITKDSVNGVKEVKSYSWREKDGKPLEEVVKINDDFCDSFRMAIYSHLNKVVPNFG